MNTAIPYNCAVCSKVVAGTVIWSGGLPFHPHCADPPQVDFSAFKKKEQEPLVMKGFFPPGQLTEDDVRRIVREELAAASN